MPFAAITEDSEMDRIILLQQMCGLITDSYGRDHAWKQVNEWLAETGLKDWTDRINLTDSSLKEVIRHPLS